jgi:hypothetical protein
MMMRRVLERFTDWRGRVVRLNCGHIITDNGSAVRRMCPECTKRANLEPYEPAYIPALHDIRCGCGPCNGRPDPR